MIARDTEKHRLLKRVVSMISLPLSNSASSQQPLTWGI